MALSLNPPTRSLSIDGRDRHRMPNLDTTRLTLIDEQLDNLGCTVVAEELTFVLLVKGNAMVSHQADELFGSIAGQRRFYKPRVQAKKVLWAGVAVGEVASTSTADSDLFANRLGMVEHQNRQATLASNAGAEESCRAGTNHNDVVMKLHEPWNSLSDMPAHANRLAQRLHDQGMRPQDHWTR
ncbi:MAG: hypothetical protein RL483_667 [Pseudomonadota bacterium]